MPAWNLRQGQHGLAQRAIRDGLQLCHHGALRPRPPQFRCDVGIQEEHGGQRTALIGPRRARPRGGILCPPRPISLSNSSLRKDLAAAGRLHLSTDTSAAASTTRNHLRTIGTASLEPLAEPRLGVLHRPSQHLRGLIVPRPARASGALGLRERRFATRHCALVGNRMSALKFFCRGVLALLRVFY